jgi:adenine/guanine phosphoribosyltransferase-like PRPP-binding protein
MDDTQIWGLLRAGGAVPEPVPGSEPRQQTLSKYDGLADPRGAEQLGAQLAQLARELQPTLVLVWEDPRDVVLGHIVARELGVSCLRSFNQEGLVGLAGGLAPASRVLLVSDAFRDTRGVLAMASVVEARHSDVAGAAVLVETESLRSARAKLPRIVSLATLAGSRPASELTPGNR